MRPLTLAIPSKGRLMETTAARLEKAGFEVSALLGDYRGGAWDPRAEVWVILARKC